jgi:hypothetical protein
MMIVINKILIIILFLVILSTESFSQSCEKFKRELFHFLPKDFPDSINCKDSSGKKQGWWIHYTIQYNPIEEPDVLAKGDYVPEYNYGQYLDDRKIGVWKKIFNVHLISEIQKEIYYYTKDTSRITSSGNKEFDIIYINDSTIIQSTILHRESKYPICIDCRKLGICIMTYRNKTIKKFSFEDFDFEFERSFFMYEREKKIIDQALE